MKRMERDPIKFAALEHYAAIARKDGLRLNNAEDMEKFAATMMTSLKGELSSSSEARKFSLKTLS